MKAVIDTNVLVSGLYRPEGNPAEIINLILNFEITILYDIRIINEYLEVLSRKKFGFPKEIVYPLIDFLKKEGIGITANPTKKKFNDEGDKKFYETAISGNADYLITGNLKHYPKSEMIVSPKEFLEKYLG